MDSLNFNNIICSAKPVFLSGIGGVSMRALAGLLMNMGACVRGSDRDESPVLAALRANGALISVPQAAENVSGAALLIRTAAVRDDNPEIVAARAQGIPVMERSEAWGLLMRGYGCAVCVAGTHGKTTTTAMLAALGVTAGLDPTVMVGGDLPLIGGTLRIGSRSLIVAEACEYKNSFLNFYPTVAVILNAEYDHPDFFPDLAAVIRSFRDFALRTPEDGTVIFRGDDKGACAAVADVQRSKLTFGFSEKCAVRAENIRTEAGKTCFDIAYNGEKWAQARLSVPGRHNVSNALAAAAASIVLGISPEKYARGIAEFSGVGRRMELRGTWRGCRIYDDYAHHPSEIAASLAAAKTFGGRVLCAFQPHTYSRTAVLLNDFAGALSAADEVIICPIFAAREKDTLGVTQHSLSELIPGARIAQSLEDAAKMLKETARAGDIMITMGAGDVCTIADMLKE